VPGEVDQRDVEVPLERLQRVPEQRVLGGAVPFASQLFAQLVVEVMPGFPV
jgi:hypothetical protein